MLIVNEYPERYGWWNNEMQCLGTKKTNELDLEEIRNLTENIKKAFYHNYKADRD
jgi:hypothetical protein